MLQFYLGCMFEVFFTTLGMADRFVSVKREQTAQNEPICSNACPKQTN